MNKDRYLKINRGAANQQVKGDVRQSIHFLFEFVPLQVEIIGIAKRGTCLSQRSENSRTGLTPLHYK